MGKRITDKETNVEEPLSFEEPTYKLCKKCQLSFERDRLDDDGLCPDCANEKL